MSRTPALVIDLKKGIQVWALESLQLNKYEEQSSLLSKEHTSLEEKEAGTRPENVPYLITFVGVTYLREETETGKQTGKTKMYLQLTSTKFRFLR